MGKRVCSSPGCGQLVDQGVRGGRCAPCERDHDRARGTRQQRGYDAHYDAQRLDYEHRMAAGETFTCWRCAELGHPHTVDPTAWHLGHDNTDRTILRGPQCPSSNLNTATTKQT